MGRGVLRILANSEPVVFFCFVKFGLLLGSCCGEGNGALTVEDTAGEQGEEQDSGSHGSIHPYHL